MVKVQIRRLSPHQNGKVVAVLMLVVSLPLFAIMAVAMWYAGPQLSEQGGAVAFPVFMFVVLPFFYLIIGYVTVAIVCAVYNICFGLVGGLEFEIDEQDQAGGADAASQSAGGSAAVERESAAR